MASKNKKNATPAPTLSLTEQMEQLQKQLAALSEQKVQAEQEQQQKITEFVNGLVADLNEIGAPVTDLDGVASLIRQVQKGTLGKVATDLNRKPRTVLDDNAKASLVEIYKAGRVENATPEAKQAGQRSAIMAKFNISSATLHNILDAAGLVTKRA